jgi:hypothetical protein
MKTVILTVFLCAGAAAQTETASPATPAAVNVTVAPLAPADLESPYASPRDAARHWLQATLAGLREQHDIRAALRGFAQAYLLDRTYAPAVFNLGVMAAVAEKWDDAAGAFAEADRLDPQGLGAAARPQLERAKLLAQLDKSPEGRCKRRYDEALLGLLPVLPRLSPGDTLSALAQLGRIDPARWEAPAMLAALADRGAGYASAAKFLELAAAHAGDPAVKRRLLAAQAAATREVRYATARVSGESASEQGKYAEAAQFYESAWAAIPARSANAMDAASAHLLNDDTARAATLLVKLSSQNADRLAPLASAMLKELAAIEPAAKSGAADITEFFRDRGSDQPPRMSEMLPPIDKSPLEIYGRALPRLVEDAEPVVLLASLSADPAGGPAAAMPLLSAAAVAGDHPWAELAPLLQKATLDPSNAPARPMQAADLAHDAGTRRLLQVSSSPAGARIFLSTGPDAVCETPCSIQVLKGNYTVRLSLPGYTDAEEQVLIGTADREVLLALQPVRGSVIVESASPVAITVNGQQVATSPAELSFAPGLYRIGAGTSERTITVKPGARLRLQFKP